MRWKGWSLAVFLLSLTVMANGEPADVPLPPCPEGEPGAACSPSRKDLKEARAAFSKGLKLQREKQTAAALDQFETAARLSPRDVQYVSLREIVREQLVFERLQRGNQETLAGRQVEALAQFRSALHLDPQNEFAQQRLQDALGEWAPAGPSAPQIVAAAGELQVQPKPVRADFHYRGESRSLLSQVASAFGLSATLDDSVVSRQVRFDIEQVDFYTAIQAACDVTHTFWTPLTETQVLLAGDSADNHRQFDRMALRTFYVPGVSAPQELNDVVNLLRTVFEIKFVTPQPRDSTIAVRAPDRVLDAVTRFMDTLGDARPQVMLDIHVYEISRTVTHNMGLQIPNNFTLFNIPAGALAALGGQNIQNLINQLIASGGINQANSQALSGLLAQLQGQSQQSSIFSQPLATFGNGLTLMGLSLGTAGAQLSLNESTAKTLEHATMRVAQGNEGSLHVGARYPILNASFAPIFNTPAISQVIQNNSFQAAFPSFNYEDIGLTVKAKPVVHTDSDVSLQLELQLRTLLAQSFNGVPVIANREYKGSITLADGAPAVVAGMLSRNEQRSMTGIPGAGAVPGLNQVMASNTRETDTDELLIVITPRLISGGAHAENTEVWMAR